MGIKGAPIKDSVSVFHFVLSANKKIVDTIALNPIKRESTKAYTWISKMASLHGQNLKFKEYWPVNKDSNLKTTFIYKLPDKNLQTLFVKDRFDFVIKRKTKTTEEIVKKLSWKQNLFDSLAASVKDSVLAKALNQSYHPYTGQRTRNQLFVIHILKAKKSKILGFYTNQCAFIGDNKSRTIAHESIHYLGAPDIYIHKYWIGKRRRIVKRELREEVMNSTFANNNNCTNSYVSNYTAYTIGWQKTIEDLYEPLLKQNLMARIIFYLSLLL